MIRWFDFVLIPFDLRCLIYVPCLLRFVPRLIPYGSSPSRSTPRFHSSYHSLHVPQLVVLQTISFSRFRYSLDPLRFLCSFDLHSFLVWSFVPTIRSRSSLFTRWFDSFTTFVIHSHVFSLYNSRSRRSSHVSFVSLISLLILDSFVSVCSFRFVVPSRCCVPVPFDHVPFRFVCSYVDLRFR